jgi:hypothetical protein
MNITTWHNSTFAIGWVLCSADSYEVNQTLVHQINICGEKRQLVAQTVAVRLDDDRRAI